MAIIFNGKETTLNKEDLNNLNSAYHFLKDLSFKDALDIMREVLDFSHVETFDEIEKEIIPSCAKIGDRVSVRWLISELTNISDSLDEVGGNELIYVDYSNKELILLEDKIDLLNAYFRELIF